MSAHTKELRIKRAKLIADARAIYEAAPNGIMSAEDDAKWEVMMKEADQLKRSIDRDEALETQERELGNLNNRNNIGRDDPGELSADELAARAAFEKKVYDKYLRQGLGAVNAMGEDWQATARRNFQNAQGTGNDSAGGYLVPDGYMATIEEARLAFGGMFNPGVCYQFTTGTGNELPMPTDNDTSNEGALLGENPTSQPEQDVAFAAVRLGAYTYTSKMIKVSNQLLQDSVFDLPSFLNRKLGMRLARIEHRHCTTGDGANKPQGVVTGATSASASFAVAPGATALTADNLIELHHSIDPEYRANARYMMNDSTLLYIKKLKDGENRYLWASGLAFKEPDTIDGKPYVINQHMASIATTNKSVLFGDFQKYFIRRVAGVMVLRLTERFAELNQTAFVAFERMHAGLVDAGTHPIKYLQHA